MADSGHQLINDYKISVCESKPASGSVSVYWFTRALPKGKFESFEWHFRDQSKMMKAATTTTTSEQKNMAEYTFTRTNSMLKRDTNRKGERKIPFWFFLPFLPANYEIVIKIQNKIETNLNVVINVYVGIFHFRWWRWQRHVCFGFVFCSHSCLAIIL